MVNDIIGIIVMISLFLKKSLKNLSYIHQLQLLQISIMLFWLSLVRKK